MALDREDLRHTGLTTLSWLMEKQVALCGCFSPVGSQGAGREDIGFVHFDQQPVEVWSSLSACITALKYCGQDVRFLRRAQSCLEWFEGRNVLCIPVGCPETGACYDGLQSDGVNLNQGAESTLSYLCSIAELSQYLAHDRPLLSLR